MWTTSSAVAVALADICSVRVRVRVALADICSVAHQSSNEVVSRVKERAGKGDLFGEELSVGLDAFSDDLYHAPRYVRET